MPKDKDRVACVEDADEDGQPLKDGNKHYARSIAPSSPVKESWIKERPNTGRSRRDTRPGESAISSGSESEAPAPTSRKERKKAPKEKERKRLLPPTIVKRDREPKSERPPNRAYKTTTAVPSRPPPVDHAVYYAASPGQHTIPHSSGRPRAHSRPVSYNGPGPYAPPPPPMSKSAYYAPPPQGSFPPGFMAGPPGHGPGPGPGPGGPGPMPIPMSTPRGAMRGGPPYDGPPLFDGPPSFDGPPPFDRPPYPGPPGPYGPGPGPEYIRGNRELSDRFGPRRPQSAMGFKNSYEAAYDHGPRPPPPPKEKNIGRRTSTSGRKTSKEHDDRRRMPPPPAPQRPSSARLPHDRLPYRPPPPPSRKKSVIFDDDDFDSESEIGYQPGQPSSRSRRQSFVDDYDLERYQLEPASSNSRRRNSQYHDPVDDKYRYASRYQDGVNGSDPAPLTSHSLRRIGHGTSSRSSRSMESHDESDYKLSQTTRTTRSGSGDDDITIKIPNGAVVEVGKTKITMQGGELGGGGHIAGALRNGSDRATTVYDDDRMSRRERRMSRARAPSFSQSGYSQSGSYSRSPHYLPPPSYPDSSSYAPPYPSYPSDPHGVEYDDYDEDFY